VLKHGKTHPIIIVIIPFDPALILPSVPVLVSACLSLHLQ
jgi:hypothetical protein